MVAVTRFPILAVLIATALGVVLLASPRVEAQSVPGVTVHVEITSTGFVPQEIEIRPGWAVQWTNNDDTNHVVASTDDDADFVFDTGLLMPGESGAFVFDIEGTFEYFSVTEPDFTGTVIVSDAAETPVPPTATATSAPPTATPTPASVATPTATRPASSPTATPTQVPSTPVATTTTAPGGTATAQPTATVAPAQATPPPPSAGGAGLNAIGGGAPGLTGILLGLAVMAIAGASLLYSGSLGRIGIESPRRKK
jgi:plastocyanin